MYSKGIGAETRIIYPKSFARAEVRFQGFLPAWLLATMLLSNPLQPLVQSDLFEGSAALAAQKRSKGSAKIQASKPKIASNQVDRNLINRIVNHFGYNNDIFVGNTRIRVNSEYIHLGTNSGNAGSYHALIRVRDGEVLDSEQYYGVKGPDAKILELELENILNAEYPELKAPETPRLEADQLKKLQMFFWQKRIPPHLEIEFKSEQQPLGLKIAARNNPWDGFLPNAPQPGYGQAYTFVIDDKTQDKPRKLEITINSRGFIIASGPEDKKSAKNLLEKVLNAINLSPTTK